MQLEFGDDPATGYLDRQYMLGADLLVAPVFSAEVSVEFYLPAGSWTNYFTGQTVTGPGWGKETHGFDSIPLYVRDGAVLAIGARQDRPDYDYLDGLTLELYPSSLDGVVDGSRQVTVTTPDGESALFTIERSGARAMVSSALGQDMVGPCRRGQSVQTSTGRTAVTL